MTDVEEMERLLAAHHFDGWLCSCGDYAKGDTRGLSHERHVAMALVEAGGGDRD